jgi:hypothetical protein
MRLENLINRADELIVLVQSALANLREGGFGPAVTPEAFTNLRAASLSFIELVYGRDHSYYKEFDKKVTDSTDYYSKYALGILTAIRTELAGGWLTTTRGLISAEVFADFLEMAEHLLTERYKDPAAVLIGGVLEEHLRQLAGRARIDVVDIRDGRESPRKADALNADLAKAGIYTKLDQKAVTAWLDLRNNAAHAKYAEYTHQQVELMLAAVRDFIVRIPL